MRNISGKRIWVAGHNGMLGSALIRQLSKLDCELLTIGKGELDLRNQSDTLDWMQSNKPDIIFLAAARVGGINANHRFPADFLYENLSIQNNVIHSAKENNIKRLIFFGSSCTYPKLSSQPIREDQLYTGTPEETNIAYATAKLAGIKMIEAYREQFNLDYISVMPANSFGPGDNFSPDSSHVIPSMIKKIHTAKINGIHKVTFWGTGDPLREFLYIEDLANASIFLANNYHNSNHINVGTGEEISIKELSRLIASIIGFTGKIEFDISKPDGMMRKVLDSKQINALGWRPKFDISNGLQLTYNWFLENMANIRA